MRLPHKSSGALVDAPGTAAAVRLVLGGGDGQGAEPGKETGKEMGELKCLLIPAPFPPPQTSLLSSHRRGPE